MNPNNSSVISVIVPVFNARSYVQQCLQSIQRQTYPHLQIIVVDDGSRDGSVEIVHSMALSDKRIMLVEQLHQGQSVARNTGLDYTTGDFISFVDADDYVDDTYFETLLQGIDDCEVVQCGFRRITDAGRVVKTVYPAHFFRLVSGCARLYRRKAISDIKFETGLYYEDVLFSVDMWLRHPVHKVLHYAGYNYRFNPQSTTATIHFADLRRVFGLLWQRAVKAGFIGKIVVFYTILRLSMHFLIKPKK